ncbi:MAG: hypothetical protein U0228_00760 [Myxococcaceae bacterium]
MSRWRIALLLSLGACHPRVEVVEPPNPDPVPLCISRRITDVRVDGAALVVDSKMTDLCQQGDPVAATRLASVELERVSDCPAGELMLEIVGGQQNVRLPDFGARLAPGQLQALTGALTELATAHQQAVARAFVVRCSSPEWLFVVTNDADVEVAPYRPAVVAVEPARPDAGCGESLDVGAKAWVGRRLSTGLMPGPSNLETWTLGQSGGAARLVVQEYRAQAGAPRADEQPEPTWTCAKSSSFEGTVRGTRFSLKRQADGELLELRCTPKALAVRVPSARRVRVRSKSEECKASRWTTEARGTVQGLVCVTLIDERPSVATPWVLAPRPGVEHVTYDEDDCGVTFDALRAVPADGGVAPAIKISEQPAWLRR